MKSEKLPKILAWMIALLVLPFAMFPTKSFAESREPSLTKITNLSLTNISDDADKRAVIGSTFFFIADTANASGIELWKWSNEGGEELVKAGFLSSPANMTVVGETLFFAARGTSATGTDLGNELWKSDGTELGTVLVKDINPGSGFGNPANLAVLGTTLFFAAFGGSAEGTELWKSDGTETGTVLVKNINANLNSGSGPNNLTVLGNNTIFFRASGTSDTGTSLGNELWKSDGTAAGTVLVKDIWPGSNGGSPQRLTAVNETLFFIADDGSNGRELWKSDGTEAGTVLVKNINPTSSGLVDTQWLFAFDATTIFFPAIDTSTTGVALWKSDGTEAGTVLVKDINPTSSSFAPNTFSQPAKLGGNFYFSALGNSAEGTELWKSDGTETGTVLVKDIWTGSNSSSPINLAVLGEALFFVAEDGNFGKELWKSDGTETGTVPFKDIWNGSNGSNPGNSVIGNFLVAGSRLYFIANDSASLEWWVLDNAAVSEPTITGIYPSSGITAGGTRITITGTNFASGVTVTIGGTACSQVITDMIPTEIGCITPSGSAGSKDVVLTNTDSGAVTFAGGFTYQAPTPAPAPVYIPDPSITPGTQTISSKAGIAITPTSILNASYFSGMVKYSISPSLPEGLVLNPLTGVISGSPTTVQAVTSYTITGTGAFSGTARSTVLISVAASITPSIQKIEASAGSAIVSSSTFNPFGFVGDIKYSVSPTLPAGLSIDTKTGVITGIPTLAQKTKTYTITAAGSTAGSANAEVAIEIMPQLVAVTESLVFDAGMETAPVLMMSPLGLSVGITYSISPALPVGITFNSETGVLSGAPTSAQSARDYSIVAAGYGADNVEFKLTSKVSIEIKSRIQLIGSIANNKFTVTQGRTTEWKGRYKTYGFKGVVRYSISPALPDGLMINPTNGAIRGETKSLITPTTFTISAIGSKVGKASIQVVLEVIPRKK